MFRFIHHRGRSEERVFELSGSMTIGRGSHNAIEIRDNNLSRSHLRLDVISGRVVVTDLRSRNGTFVNGTRIERKELSIGDVVRCGSQTFELAGDMETEEPTGVVLHIRAPSPPLTMEELLLARSATTNASSSLRLHYSKDSARRSQQKLQILLEVSRLLSSPEPLDSLLERILDLLFRILDVERGAILMVGPDGVLEPRAVKSTFAIGAGATIWSRHIVDYVRTTGAAAIFGDAAQDSRLIDRSSILAQSIRGSMCAPLRPKQDVVGVLYVDNCTNPGLFSGEDLEFLGAFANQAAIAIENANLYRQIENEAILRNNLLRFFPPTTIQRLGGVAGASLGVIETEVTALFADISGFTEMSSTMEPREVIELLNEYFPVMAKIVFEHEGTLEKYIGDALLAVWGAPFAHHDDADRAVRAAIEMQRAASTLSHDLQDKRGIAIRIHIGLNTGMVTAGNIGSDQYIQYATIGDSTNVASRICNAAPRNEIWIAASTKERLTDPTIPVEEIGPIRVKGKEDALLVCRVPWPDLHGGASDEEEAAPMTLARRMPAAGFGEVRSK